MAEKNDGRRGFAAETWRRFKKNKPAVFGLAVFSLVVMVALTANLIIPVEKTTAIQGAKRLTPPGPGQIFGTDNVGRDIFARVVHGTRYSVSMGLIATTVALVIGSILGAACGYYGGLFDSVTMRILDVINSLPSLLLLLAIVSTLGKNYMNMLIAMTVSLAPGFVRLVRSTVLSISDMEYIQAASAYGTSSLGIIVRHVLPNAMGVLIVNGATSVSGAILAAAGLSFLGFGVQPPTPEWGVMLSEARGFMREAPWFTLFPGLAIVVTALSINLMGDGLRDALDPRLKD